MEPRSVLRKALTVAAWVALLQAATPVDRTTTTHPEKRATTMTSSLSLGLPTSPWYRSVSEDTRREVRTGPESFGLTVQRTHHREVFVTSWSTALAVGGLATLIALRLTRPRAPATAA